MKKNLVIVLSLLITAVSGFSQSENVVKQPSLGLHFVLNDFKTAGAIRSSSLNAVLREKRNAKIKEMSPGLALTYLKGINTHVDFSTTLSGSFVQYPFENGITPSGDESFLLEAD